MKNIENYIKNTLFDCPDLKCRTINLNPFSNVKLFFMETLISQNKINEYILKYFENKKIINITKIPGINYKEINKDEIINFLYNGYTIILYKNLILSLETKADNYRSISTNNFESSIKGPKNAFIESYEVNVGLIKKRIKTNDLKIKEITLGNISKTKIGIMYLADKIKPFLLENVLNSLYSFNEDILNDSIELIKYIDNKSIFPTIIVTERPDRCSMSLSKGKIVIICDESSTALILPSTLFDFTHPFTDIYLKKKNVILTKILRVLCFFLSIFIPAFYIAIINYNQETIPTSLIINFASQREAVPFPAVVECIIMLIICEILKESDLRFPSKYGSAISILGALVLGDAAVAAGLVSPIMIIVVAFTYISSLIFFEPELTSSIRFFRFFSLILSSFFGLYGFLLSIIFLIVYLSSLKSGDNYYFEMRHL